MPHFLTLPFTSTSKIHIQRGWWTVGSTGQFNLLHHAIDYIKGIQDDPVSWQNFDVAAAADGEACAAKLGQTGCYDVPGEVMGNRVLIRHSINGVTYYTFYNHLKSIDPRIPLNDRNKTIHVKQGQVIGVAGASGNDPTFIHLHFELQDANHKWIDPYGLYSSSRNYPDPAGRKNDLLSGSKNYWTTNPPSVLGPKPKPTPSPKPSPAPSIGPSPSAAATASTASPSSGAATTLQPGPALTPSSPSANATQGSLPSLASSGAALRAPPSAGAGGPDPVPIAIGLVAAGGAVVALGWFALGRRRRPS